MSQDGLGSLGGIPSDLLTWLQFSVAKANTAWLLNGDA